MANLFSQPIGGVTATSRATQTLVLNFEEQVRTSYECVQVRYSADNLTGQNLGGAQKAEGISWEWRVLPNWQSNCIFRILRYTLSDSCWWCLCFLQDSKFRDALIETAVPLRWVIHIFSARFHIWCIYSCSTHNIDSIARGCWLKNVTGSSGGPDIKISLVPLCAAN